MRYLDATNELLKLLSDFILNRNGEKKILNYEVVELAKIHQVEGILYYITKDARLQSAYYRTISAYSQRRSLINSIEKAFKDNSLEYYIVKGAIVAEHYPVPALRSMGDCDITVKDQYSAGKVLENLGFVENTHNKNYEWVYLKNGFEFEIHSHLLYNKAFNRDTEKAFVNQDWNYVKDNRIDIDYHFIYLLIHLKKHMINYGVGFRQFMDIAVELLYAGINIDNINKLIDCAGIRKFAGNCFALCERWFGIEVPFKEKITEEFYLDATEKISKNGVFGFSVEENRNNGFRNRVRRNGRLRSVIKSFFPSYESFCKVEYYSWIKGKPYLLPLAWLYRFYRSLKYSETRKKGARQVKVIRTINYSEYDAYWDSWGF